MKLKFLVCLSGPEYTFKPGDETDRFDDDEAQRFVHAGIAEVVKAAAKPAPRTARPAGKGKRK